MILRNVFNVPENDGPDHSQGHLDIAINNLLGTNGHQLHTLAGDEVQSLVHIRDLVEPKSQSMRYLFFSISRFQRDVILGRFLILSTSSCPGQA